MSYELTIFTDTHNGNWLDLFWLGRDITQLSDNGWIKIISLHYCLPIKSTCPRVTNCVKSKVHCCATAVVKSNKEVLENWELQEVWTKFRTFHSFQNHRSPSWLKRLCGTKNIIIFRVHDGCQWPVFSPTSGSWSSRCQLWWCHWSGQKVSTSNSQSSYSNPLYQRKIINILSKQRIWQYFIFGV